MDMHMKIFRFHCIDESDRDMYVDFSAFTYDFAQSLLYNYFPSVVIKHVEVI